MEVMDNSDNQEQTISLLPLPESLKHLAPTSHAESHWTTTVKYIINLSIADLEDLFYVIGFSLTDQPVETSAIKYNGQYYSPLLSESETHPFKVAFELDAQAIYNFHGCHQRPPAYFDFVSNNAAGRSCTGCITRLQLEACPLSGMAAC